MRNRILTGILEVALLICLVATIVSSSMPNSDRAGALCVLSNGQCQSNGCDVCEKVGSTCKCAP
jgi:hypothetical protein